MKYERVEIENMLEVCHIKDANGEMVTKEVVTGIENTIYVEIVEGLQEGDTVYAASKVSRKEEKKSKKDDNTESSESQEEGMQNMMPEGMDFEMPEGGVPGGMDFEMPEGGVPGGMGGQMPDFGR